MYRQWWRIYTYYIVQLYIFFSKNFAEIKIYSLDDSCTRIPFIKKIHKWNNIIDIIICRYGNIYGGIEEEPELGLTYYSPRAKYSHCLFLYSPLAENDFYILKFRKIETNILGKRKSRKFKFQCRWVKFYWNTAMSVYLHTDDDGFCSPTAELSDCDRDTMARKA